jgi:hypothetical protein
LERDQMGGEARRGEAKDSATATTTTTAGG